MAEPTEGQDPQTHARLEALRQEIRDLHGKLAMAEHRNRVLESTVEALRRRYENLTRRKVVRLSLAFIAWIKPFLRPVYRLLKRARALQTVAKPQRAKRVSTVPRRTVEELTSGILAQRPGPHPTQGPKVSMVVLTRNGRHHVERLLGGLKDRTAYRNFELVVVDNGSTDDTAALLQQDHGFSIRVIRNEHNATFSDGNNQGIAEATGELVLLLNNDVDPINDGWLGAMVSALTDDVGAVGALLIYPKRPPGLDLQGDSTFDDLSIQHRGIAFGFVEGAPRARNVGGGEDPLDASHAQVKPIPAVTAACLLAKKSDLKDVGMLTSGYIYGTEDVDLCLKLRARGRRIVFCGQAALFHHEFGTQSATQREIKRQNRLENRRLFLEKWAPVIARSIRRDEVNGGGDFTAREAPIVAITVTKDDPTAGWGDWYTGHELGDSLEKQGWTVIYAEAFQDRWYELPDSVDIVISLLDRYDVSRAPSGAFTIAWARNWVDRWVAHPWFEKYDLVVASSAVGADVIRNGSQTEPATLPLAANPERFQPLPPVRSITCDFSFAGNNWGHGRKLIENIEVHPGETFVLFGKGWEKVPAAAPYYRGHLDFHRLPELHSSSKIVLDDTAGHTLPYGALNSRVFEALATGALVITDNVVGAREFFGDLLPTFSSPEELRAQLDKFLGDDDLRKKMAARLREIVLKEHTYERRAAQFLDLAQRAVMKPKVALKIGPPNHEVAESWGDTHFARAFARSLRSLGFATSIDILPEWDAPDRQDADIVVHLRGLKTYIPKDAHFNALWIISHPELVDPAECDMFDVVFVASSIFAEQLREKVNVPVHVLHQATDTHRFSPVDPDASLRSELLFVGNSRGQHREAIDWAIEVDAPLAVYGSAWDGIIPSKYVRGTYFPNEGLAQLYGSAAIVLNDHWPDMREQGFISNRVFDVLAAGAFLISDPVSGLSDVLGDAVPTFSSADGLRALIEKFIDDPEARRGLAQKGMEIVRRSHSFDARAAEFIEILRPLFAERPLTIDEMAARAERVR